jgi:hypothetical protein
MQTGIDDEAHRAKEIALEETDAADRLVVIDAELVGDTLRI